MTKDLERLARAAHEIISSPHTWNSTQLAQSITRAILRELREPSEAMSKAGDHVAMKIVFPAGGPFEHSDLHAGIWAAWQAMIDTILTEDNDPDRNQKSSD